MELIIPTERSGLKPQPMGRHDVVLASIFDNPTDCPEDLNWTLCTDWLPAEWRWSGPLPGRGPSPVVADLDRNGTKEILLASPVGAVLIWEAGYQSGFTCEPKLAWPFRLVDAATTPVVADIDGDDCLEMAIGDEAGYVHLFELPGLAVCDPPSLEEMPWPMACANPHRTGEHASFVGFRQEGEPEVAGLTVSPPSPNPFNPVVRLRYQLPYPARVRVAIYETTGRETAVLYEGPADAGSHDLLWDGRDGSGHPVASGVYLARVELGDYRMAQKITLLK